VKTGRTTMDWLLPVGFIAVWLLLQLWILPKLGIGT
jgi:hypothetical protein